MASGRIEGNVGEIAVAVPNFSQEHIRDKILVYQWPGREVLLRVVEICGLTEAERPAVIEALSGWFKWHDPGVYHKQFVERLISKLKEPGYRNYYTGSRLYLAISEPNVNGAGCIDVEGIVYYPEFLKKMVSERNHKNREILQNAAKAGDKGAKQILGQDDAYPVNSPDVGAKDMFMDLGDDTLYVESIELGNQYPSLEVFNRKREKIAFIYAAQSEEVTDDVYGELLGLRGIWVRPDYRSRRIALRSFILTLCILTAHTS